jgi:hypothetical protein
MFVLAFRMIYKIILLKIVSSSLSSSVIVMPMTVANATTAQRYFQVSERVGQVT